MTKQPKRKSIGLLFASRATYEERMWQMAYSAAIKSGKTPIEAQQIADEAAAAAKGQKQNGTPQNA